MPGLSEVLFSFAPLNLWWRGEILKYILLPTLRRVLRGWKGHKRQQTWMWEWRGSVIISLKGDFKNMFSTCGASTLSSFGREVAPSWAFLIFHLKIRRTGTFLIWAYYMSDKKRMQELLLQEVTHAHLERQKHTSWTVRWITADSHSSLKKNLPCHRKINEFKTLYASLCLAVCLCATAYSSSLFVGLSPS